jgi:transposase
LLALLGQKDALIERQNEQIRQQAEQISLLMEQLETVSAKLAKLEHLLSRNSRNSSAPPSRDDDLGKPGPEPKEPASGGEKKRQRGKQKGAPGTNLAWSETPDAIEPQFPHGSCGCGADLAEAADLGVVDRYQQHEIPPMAVTVTQFDQHAVLCRCGATHVAARPEGAPAGQSATGVGYGPNLQAWAVYLLVAHFIPARRVVEILESLTGSAPSLGFVHGMLRRAALALEQANARIRMLITLAYAICVDETPLRVGPAKAPKGKKRAEKYLLVACTELYTAFLLGDRSLETFKKFIFADLRGSVIVHDRYQNYDSAEPAALGGTFIHQFCTQHILRDLAGAAELYPDAVWPTQIADALRMLIHLANLAREQGHDNIEGAEREEHLTWLRRGVAVGLAETLHHGKRPGERKARLLLEFLRDRHEDMFRFAHDLNVPPYSAHSERISKPKKITSILRPPSHKIAR